MTLGPAPDEIVPRTKARGRKGPPAWARRTALGVVVGGLLLGNAWVVRKQFFLTDRQKNAAYDAGLRALDMEPRDLPLAEASFRRYLEFDPRSLRVRCLLGVALQYQGKLAEARDVYAAILERDAEFDDARVALVEIAMGEQSYEEAKRELELAAARDPTPAAVHVLRARLLAAIGDHEGAIEAYRETLRRDPESFESAIELGDLLLARSALGGSLADRSAAAAVYHDAEDVLKRRLANTNDKRLRLLLAKSISGQVTVLQQRELSEAVAELRKAAELDPADPEPAIILGGFFRAAGNLEEARRTLEDARGKWKDTRILVALADLSRAQNRPDDALKLLDEAVTTKVDDPSLRVRLIGSLAALRRFDDANREADAARQLFPDDDGVHAACGDLAREEASAAELASDPARAAAAHRAALAAYRRALELRPRSIRLKKLVAGELIETALSRAPGTEMSDDEKFARACIEDVLRLNANDAEALAWNARLAVADGKFDEVVASLRPVLASPSPPVEALRVLGLAAARASETRVAADAFARVISILRDAAAGGPPGAGPRVDDWLNAVHSALQAGRSETAVEFGAAAVALHPASLELAREFAAAHLSRGDTASALKILRAARTDHPEDLEVRLLLARAWESAGRLDAAEEELKSAVIDLPGDASRMRYFEFLARCGRAGAAEEGFLAMIASDPDGPAGYLRLGDFYLTLKPPRTDAALAQYQKAADLTKGGAGPLLRIAELRLGVAAKDAAGYAAAERAAEAFAQASPGDPWCDYLSGKLALAGGRPADALAPLERFAAKAPNSAAGLYYYGLALRAAKRTDDALAALERAARLGKDDPAIALELATVRHDAGVDAFKRGDYANAQRLFAAAEAGGAGRGSRLLLAGARANAGELELSEKECRGLLEDEPDNTAAIHLLAQLLLRKPAKEALDEAESLFRRALAKDANDILARLGIGTVRFERGDFHGALESFRATYPLTGGAPGVAMMVAQCMALVNDSAGAVVFLEGEVKAHPESPAMHHMLGDVLVYLKQPADAVREFLKAHDLDPAKEGPLLAAAAASMAARDYAGARKLLTERMPRVEAKGLVHLALGEVLLLEDRAEEAAQTLRQALAEIPGGHPRALYLLGRIADRGGARDEAKRFYREAAKCGSVEADVYARLAQFASAEGDRRLAIEEYTTALRFEPRNVVVLNNLANLLGEEEGRLDDAIRIAERACTLVPERAEFADTCGWLYFRAGRLKEATALLERAASTLRTNAVIQFHAGMALSRMSRTTDARDCLSLALRLDPKFEGAEAARAELEKLR